MTKMTLLIRKYIRALCILFVLFNILSFIYVIKYGRFNGDYITYPCKLSICELIFVLFTSSIPFYFLYRLYLYFSKYEPRKKQNIRISHIRQIFILLAIWQIFVTTYWGVGKMGNEVYSAPFIATAIIVITNRIPLSFLCSILLLSNYPKLIRFSFLAVTLFVTILKNSLGDFFLLSLIYVLGNIADVVKFIRKHFIIAIIAVMFFPSIASSLYTIRDVRRNNSMTIEEFRELPNVTLDEIIFGKLLGRLSTFSNLAIIIQDPDYFKNTAPQLNLFYPINMALWVVLGNHFRPDCYPEKIMVNFLGDSADDISFMAGLPGLLIISYYKSLVTLIFVVIVFVILCILIFKICRLLPVNNPNEFATINLLIMIYSGTFTSFFSFILSFVLFILIIKLYKFLIQIAHK